MRPEIQVLMPRTWKKGALGGKMKRRPGNAGVTLSTKHLVPLSQPLDKAGSCHHKQL
jgi:hypothetical protein